MSHVLLAACADAVDLRDRIRTHLDPLGVNIHIDLATFPDPEEEIVVLVVLSPAALADKAIESFVHRAFRRRLPLVPVVEDRDTFDFRTIPKPELEQLERLNAVGWQPGDGQAILSTVRGILGLEVFPRQRKVFISYRRKDGEEIARSVRENLCAAGYVAFLDIFDIEGGAPVQERIMEEIGDKDFVLLIDTPAARQSDWVRSEIVEALSLRIPVRVLSVGQDDAYPLLPHIEHLRWTQDLDAVRDFVARGIATSVSFDTRCSRVLQGVATARGLAVKERDRRQLLIESAGARAIFEYENVLPSLVRLHRLFRGSQAVDAPAVLISGERPIPEPTAEAIGWARGEAKLYVAPLQDAVSMLDLLL
ncbi:MAG: toll/interleukin-1 receptor domain-containing protein [bacterium]|nr:toll/interleukin-1 receptor domain-containing protein [bacterium]